MIPKFLRQLFHLDRRNQSHKLKNETNGYMLKAQAGIKQSREMLAETNSYVAHSTAFKVAKAAGRLQ